jgi:hypothetical protein
MVHFAVEQESERIEVKEQRGCVVHCKMNLDDSLLIRRKKAVAVNDEMRKYAREVIFLASSGAGAWNERC